MDQIGDRLRILREREGKTQAEISKLLGTTQQIYSRYETNRNDLPIRHLLFLAAYYRVSADYLLGRTSCPALLPEYTVPFLQNITVGDLVCRISTFSDSSRKLLIEYANYLSYREAAARRARNQNGMPAPERREEGEAADPSPRG